MTLYTWKQVLSSEPQNDSSWFQRQAQFEKVFEMGGGKGVFGAFSETEHGHMSELGLIIRMTGELPD